MPKSVERQQGVVRQIPLSATSRFATDSQLAADFTFGGRIELIGGENFRGRIKIFPEEVSVAMTDGEPSFWHLAEVEAREAFPGEFSIRLGDRSITFYPDDPVAFHYDGTPALNEQLDGFGVFVRRTMTKRRRGRDEPHVLAGNRAKGLERAKSLEVVEVPEQIPESDPWAVDAGDDSSVSEMGIAVAQRFRKTPKKKSKAEREPAPPVEVEEVHIHEFATQNLGGGLQRRICLDCGHLSLDLSEQQLDPIPEGAFYRRKMVYDD